MVLMTEVCVRVFKLVILPLNHPQGQKMTANRKMHDSA